MRDIGFLLGGHLPARPPVDTNRGPSLEHPPALSEGESLEGGIVAMALPCEIVPLCRASGRLWRGFPLSISRCARRRCPSPAYACPRMWSMRGLCVSTTEGTQNRAIAPSRRSPREVARNDDTAVHPRTASNSSWRHATCSWKSKKSSGHRGCTGGATNEERGGDRTFAGSWRRWRGASPPSRL